MSATNIARHAGGVEPWIAARAIVNRGWLPMPRHAIGGRHASPATRRGQRIAARRYGVDRPTVRNWAWSAAREAVAS